VAFRSEILVKLDKKGRVAFPAAFRDELPDGQRDGFVLYRSNTVAGLVNGNSRAGFDGMLARLRAEALGPKASLKAVLDDEAFDPAGMMSSQAREIRLDPDGRFVLPEEFIDMLDARAEGVVLLGRGEKFQLWNPARWQVRREADTARMAAFLRGLDGAA